MKHAILAILLATTAPASAATVLWPVVDRDLATIYRVGPGSRCILVLGDSLPGKETNTPMCDDADGELFTELAYEDLGLAEIPAETFAAAFHDGTVAARGSLAPRGTNNAGGGSPSCCGGVPVQLLWDSSNPRVPSLPKTPVTPVPLPASLWLMLAGIFALWRARR